MIPHRLLKKIKALEIRTRRVVDSTFSGHYHSVFKGQGINFSDLREYQLGDDFRLIDWKTTARSGTPFVKIFEEERELTVILMVDISQSGHFGSSTQTKVEQAAELAAILGFSAITNQDKVGLILFAEDVETFIPPKKGKEHILRLIRDVFYFKPRTKKTSISTALEFLVKTNKKKAIVFLISDFIDSGFEKALRIASQKHDVVPVVLEDERELSLPKVGMLALEDEETSEVVYVNTNRDEVRQSYRNMVISRQMAQDRLFKSLKLTAIRLQTGVSFIKPLIQFFKQRAR